MLGFVLYSRLANLWVITHTLCPFFAKKSAIKVNNEVEPYAADPLIEQTENLTIHLVDSLAPA